MRRANTIKSLILCLLMVFLTSGHLCGGSEGLANEPTVAPGNGTENTPEFKEGELIVRFKPNISKSRKERLHARHGSKVRKEYSRFDMDHVEIEKGVTVKDAMGRYKADPDVLYTEPNYVVKIQALPNDPFFTQSWSLLNTGQTGGTPGADIDAQNAWNITTGSNNVVVAVIDTGVDYGHADLSANIWVNTGEIAGNGIDDDGNGYIDDIHGIDTMNNDSDPFDDNGHGTHVSGIIGALGNNAVGVAGVNWDVSILACKFVDANGYGFLDGAIRCLDYVKAMKARGVNIVATNNSWGGFAFSQALYDAINAQRDILFFAAAGNGYGGYNDTDPLFPASYFLPNVVSVTATDHNDAMPGFANFGRRSVHLGAPGQSILSTLPEINYFHIPGGYGSYSGTSMATPHAAGLAALIEAQNPSRSWIDLKNLILSGGDTVASMTGTTLTGKRLNAFGSLSCVNSPVFSAIAFPTVFTAGTQEFLAALSINCASSVGPVTVTSSAGETVTLRDDGVAPDLAAGDGIFSAVWTPASPYTNLVFASPAGSEAAVAPVPDLVITAVSGPASAGTEELVTLTATVKNVGVVMSGPFNVGFYLSMDGSVTAGDTLIGSSYVQGLAVGREQTLSITVPISAGTASGTYFLGAIADYENVVVKAQRATNGLTGNQITIAKAFPDLVTSAVSGAATGNTGQSISVAATVRNQGQAGAGSFNVGVYLSTDPAITASDVLLGAGTASSLVAGAQRTVTIAVMIPQGLTGGVYYLGVIADYDGTLVEPDETNNALAGNQITITKVSPDLVVTTASGPTTSSQDQLITVTATVRNQGQAAAGLFYIGFYLSADGTITSADTMLGAASVTSLAVGAQTTVTARVFVPANLTDGTYFMGAVADHDGIVAESTETNNALAGNQIAISKVYPDMVMLAVSGPATATPRQSITVTVTMKNQGQFKTGSLTTGVFLSTDQVINIGDPATTDLMIGTVTLPDVAAGTQRTLSFNVTVPATVASGAYYLTAIADYANGVAESNETNNAVVGTPIVVGYPDLIVPTVSGPGSAVTGQTISVTASVRNQGLVRAGQFSAGLYLSTDATITTADVIIASTPVSALAAGAEQALTYNATIPTNLAAGTYYLGVLADYANVVVEADETNNALAPNQITITRGFPDLVATAVSGPASAGTGQPVTVTVTARNQGQSVAGSFSVGIYLSTDAAITTGDTFLGSGTVSTLAAGAAQTLNVTATIPANLAPGTYVIGAIVDQLNAVSESDETNNSLAGNQISITPAFPDLTLTSVSGPLSANTEQAITVSVTVANQGVSGAGTFIVGIYLSTDAAITTADTLVGTRQVTSLAGGGQQVLNVTVAVPAGLTTGTYYTGAIADYTNTVIESVETNNAFTGNQVAITKVFPDLLITTVTGPVSANTEQAISVAAAVRNQGPVNAGQFSVGIYLSTDPAVTTSDVFIGSSTVRSLVAGGQQLINVTVVVPASLTSGTYHIGAIADYTNTIVESDEANNSLAGNQTAVTKVFPDLVMTAVSGPTTAAAGQLITVTATTGNQGLGSASGFTVGLYLSTDPLITTGDVRIGSSFVSSLGVGATRSLSATVTVPAGLASGTYYIGAVADYLTAVTESDEANNGLAGNQLVIP